MATTRTAGRLSDAASVVLPAGLIVGAFAAAMLTAAGARLDAPAWLGLVYGGAVVAASGYLIARLTLSESPSQVGLAILLGSGATSLFLTCVCILTGMTAGTIFAWWSVIVAAVVLRDLLSPRSPAVTSAHRIDLQDAAAIVWLALIAGLWCHRTATLLPTLRATGVAPVWSDYFIHATEIAQFGDPLAAGRSSFLLVDQPLVFYHYASYLLPAAVERLVDLPVLGLATGLWLPYGILLTVLGIYVFVKTIASSALAVVVPMALLLLPDAASSGFRNGFFGFHWLLFAGPGSGYALGLAFTALATMALWQKSERPSTLWLALIITASIFEFRAQIFVLFVPALTMTLLWESNLLRRHRPTIVIAMACAAAVAVAVVAAVPAARQMWMQFSAFGSFMETVHTGMSPTGYDGMYQGLVQRHGPVLAQALGFVALIPIALGGLTIALPAALTGAIRRTGWHSLDSFPLWCAGGWLALVLVAPTAHANATEYQHRPFVLVYAAALVWTLVWLDRSIRSTRPDVSRVYAVPVLIAAALAISVAVNRDKDRGQPAFAWGDRFYGVTVERGLLDAASFVRAQTVAGDTFALIPSDQWTQLDDSATRFASLSNVPAYLARAGIQVLNGTERQAVVERRLAALREIESTNDMGVALTKLRTIGVRFLVALGDSGPRFDPQGAAADFRTPGASVYRVESKLE
jgi:hypothetical protein